MTTKKKLHSTDKENTKETPSNTDQEHPINEAITCFLHASRDIKWSGRVFAPLAAEFMKKNFSDAKKQLTNGEFLIGNSDSVERVHGLKEIRNAIYKIKRLSYSQTPKIILNSLFLSLFSALDNYTGELLTSIYKKKPELFNKINKKIDLIDVLSASSIEGLKQSVLENEIEDFRRKSYIEQFEVLESTFGVPLKKFKRWPDFVECTQRRNLITHCGGIVSEQYIKICKEADYPIDKIPAIGAKLECKLEYFSQTCELLIEVGLKLGQTLWRKVFPNELKEADHHLTQTQYDALYSHNWERAIVFGEFATGLLKFSSELEQRIFIINYCIALKFSGNEKAVEEKLKEFDWSATIDDFRLAEAVLQDRFQDAAKIMKQIGKEGKMVNEEGYHTWPLFHMFREKPEFLENYESIYGYPFETEVKRVADKALIEAPTDEVISNKQSVDGDSDESEIS